MTDDPTVLDDLERRLIAGCYGSPARTRRHWAPALVAVAAVVIVAAVVAVLASGGATTSASAALGDAASAAGRQPALAPLSAGEYWYTRAVVSDREPVAVLPKGAGPSHPQAPRIAWLVVRESLQTWMSADGTLRTRIVPLGRRFASPTDRAIWAASGTALPALAATDVVSAGDGWFPPAPIADAGGDIGDGLFSYRQLLALPTAPRALLARVNQALTDRQRRESAAQAPAGGAGTVTLPFPSGGSAGAEDRYELVQAAVGLFATPLPTRVRAALFRALALVPDATVEREARDPLGRPGTAVTFGAGAPGTRIVFDQRTGTLLADAQNGPADISTTTVAQGVVGSIYAVPRGLAPITSGPPAPRAQTIAVSPRAGTPTTTFTVTVSGGPSPTVLLLAGPSGPGCAASPPQPLPGGSTPTQRVSVRLLSGDVGRSRWCAGRYQVQDVAQAPGSASESAVAVYFQVR